jgi:hypothetical protein
MILIAIFILVFLIGFSLFAAVLGSSFLGKHARRVVKAGGRTPTGRRVSEKEIAQRFKEEYEEGVVQTAGASSTRTPKGVQSPVAMPYAPPARAGRGGMWVLVSLGIAAVILFSAFFVYPRASAYVSAPRLIFCEGVDYLTQKPENRSDTFTRGNVTLFLRSRKPLDIDSATVKITRVGPAGPEEYDRKTIPIKPGWSSFSLTALFGKTGAYEVAILAEEGGLVDRRVIYIVPDSFAFKPVPGN